MTELSFGVLEVSFLLMRDNYEKLQNILWQKWLSCDRSGFLETEVTFFFWEKQKCPFPQNFVSEVSFAQNKMVFFDKLPDQIFT